MISFIHVGKCAGTSIGIFLRENGIPHQEYHCFDANEKLAKIFSQNIDEDFFLLTIRDPIKRFISAFYWDLYEKRILQDLKGPHSYWKEIYNEFRSPNDLAEALTSEYPDLRRLSRIAFEGSFLHIHLTLSWYVPPNFARCLNKNNAFCVRTEFADHDMSEYMEKYFNYEQPVVMSREKSNYRSELSEYDDFLSNRSISNLKEVYRDDYRTINCLKHNGLISNDYVNRLFQ